MIKLLQYIYQNLTMVCTTQEFSIKLDILDEMWGSQSGVAEDSSVPIGCYAKRQLVDTDVSDTVIFQKHSKYLPNSMAQQPRRLNLLDVS